MKRKLEFNSSIMSRVFMTLEAIAKKNDLKPNKMNFIGIHNRRNKSFLEQLKKNHKRKPLKKSYFYDAMEEMRESYENTAFLYVSDDMKWGRSNLKVQCSS